MGRFIEKKLNTSIDETPLVIKKNYHLIDTILFSVKNKKFLFNKIKIICILALLFFVLLSSGAEAAITYQSAGTIDYSAQNGSSVSPGYPASISAGDLLVLIIGMKPSTANSGGVTTPTGWTQITSITGAGGYTTTLGADTGNTNLFGFYKVATGGETGTLPITLSTNNVSWAQMLRFSNATGYWDVAGTTGSDVASGSVSIAFGSNPGVTSGDHIIGAMTIPTDVTTPAQFSVESFSQTGVTFGTTTEIIEPDSGTGNDIGGFIVRSSVSSGTATANPTMTATAGGTTTNVRGPGIFIRIREPAVTSPVVTTQTVTGILPTEAVGNGTVTSNGNGVITERGIVWGTAINPTTSNNKATASGTVGAFTANITSLNPNTLYHVRAYAINSAGTSYGSDVTFTSQATPSVVLNTPNGSVFGSDSTPTLEMTATDPTNDDVNYNLQIHTTSQFLNRWVAVGGADSMYSIAYSDDGVNWTASPNSLSLFTEGEGVAWNGNMFVAVGIGPSDTMAYSYNGVDWVGLGNSIFSGRGRGIIWNGSMWVALGQGTVNTMAYSYDGINWTGLGKVFSSYGYGGAWNGSMWVAVGYGTHSIVYSYDGINWTGVTAKTIFNGNGRDVVWDGTKFVAVGNSNYHTIAYSYDGINWIGEGISIFGEGDNKGHGDDIAYGNNMFVAVGAEGPNSLAYSSDGINWTGLGTSLYSQGWGVSFDGHKFIVASGGNDKLYYSTNGINWSPSANGASVFANRANDVANTTPVSLIPSIDFMDKVSGADSGFVNTVVGGDTAPFNSGNKVSYTVQAGNELPAGTYYWRARATDPSGSNIYGEWSETRSFTVGVMLPTLSTGFVLNTGNTTALATANITNMGGNLNDKRGFVYDTASRSNPGNIPPASTFYSGMIEESGTFGPGNFSLNISGLIQGVQYYFRSYSHNSVGYAYGNEIVLQFVPSVSLNTADNSIIADTTPSLEMTGVDINNDDLHYNIRIQKNSNFIDRWVAVGDGLNNTIAYSDDGISWTGIGKTIFTGYGQGIAWSGEKFVAVGNGTNSLAYSSDGINWTGLGTDIFSTGAQGVAWNGEKFVAVGDGTNSIAYSSDGINWTGVTGRSIFSTKGNAVAWNGNMWIAVGIGSNTIAYSYNGIDWTGLGTDVFSSSGDGVAWGGDKFVITGGGTNSIAYSYNGIDWTGVTGKTIFSVNGEGITWNGTRFVATGDGSSNTIAYSDDGINWTGSGKVLGSFGYTVIWNGKMFIAGGNGLPYTMYYSYDGINWQFIPGTDTLFSVDVEGVATTTPASLVPSIPVLNKNSIEDSGFLNSVSTGDVAPFNSNNKIRYTVPTGSELVVGDTYYWQARAIDLSGSNIYSSWSEVRSFTIAQPVLGYTQSSYRFFGNNNGSSVFSTLAPQDSAATLGSNKNDFRLRSLIHFGENTPVDGQEFKLQFSEKIGDCDALFVGENYQDVTYHSDMAYSDNFQPEDGVGLISSADDPVHSEHTIVNQTYIESNNFTNSVSSIDAGQDSKWDFALRYKGIYSSKSYCFRIVKADGSLLDSYLYIPEIITAVYRSRGGGSYNIENSANPNGGVTGGGQGGGNSVVLPQCNDGIDNDGDTLIDNLDPNCHIDGNINNPYMKGYNSESSSAIINTGGGSGGGGGGDLGFWFRNGKSLDRVFGLSFFKNVLRGLLSMNVL